LIDLLRKELLAVDDNVKARLAQYQSAKSNLSILERLRHGNLTTKSLLSLVDPSLLVQDSEFIETHLVVVPSNSAGDFITVYETLAPMVVPRSAFQVVQDPEHSLFAVSTFKKHSKDFLSACREHKWIPREFKPVTGAQDEEQRDFDRMRQAEIKARGEVLRLGKSEWSEVIKIWMHVLSLQVFVETVLRYGFPLEYTSHIIKTTPKSARKIKAMFDGYFENGESRRFKLTRKDIAASQSHDKIRTTENDLEGLISSYVYFEFSFP